MNFTKAKEFVAFRHKIDGNIYWINCHYKYEEDAPSLFKFSSIEDKRIAGEVMESFKLNWDLKELEMVLMTTGETVTEPKRSRKKKDPLVEIENNVISFRKTRKTKDVA
jgi:hypothetical protein